MGNMHFSGYIHYLISIMLYIREHSIFEQYLLANQYFIQ